MTAWWESLAQDARVGLRRAVRKPGFLVAAVVTLALGIGANTAMFSVVYGVLLKPLPFEQSDRLVSVRSTAPGIGWPHAVLAAAQYFTYREEQRVFEDVAVWQENSATITGDGEPEQVNALLVTDGFLPILRVAPALGRRFTRADDSPGSPRRAILTYGFWQQRYSGRQDVVGRTVTVNGNLHEIIGVLPRSFTFLDTKPSVVIPLAFDRATTTIMNFSYPGLARLKPGVTLDQANRDVARMIPLTPQKFAPFPALGPTWFADAKMGPDVRSLADDAVGDVGSVLWVLMGTIGLVLLIACANVANLFLVRADSRQTELAVRAAIGAGRWRIARTLLAESLTLGLAGGLVGVGLAAATVRIVRATAPSALPRVNEITIDPVVLLFAAVLSVVAGLLFGLLPVLRFSSPRLSALRDGGRTASEGRSRNRARSALVVAEIALALILLVASGLMFRTFSALRQVDPGFVRGDQLMTVDLAIPRAFSTDPEAIARRHQEIADRLAAIPGVRSVGMTSSVAMDGQGMSNPLLVEEFPLPEGQAVQTRRMKWIAPGYFETMGTRLLAGRRLTWGDMYGFAPVLVINERMARRVLEDAGRRDWQAGPRVVARPVARDHRRRRQRAAGRPRAGRAADHVPGPRWSRASSASLLSRSGAWPTSSARRGRAPPGSLTRSAEPCARSTGTSRSPACGPSSRSRPPRWRRPRSLS